MRGRHPVYATGNFPYTSPVGSFAANGYGLVDMMGKVEEWIWDRYGTYPASGGADYTGRLPACAVSSAADHGTTMPKTAGWIRGQTPSTRSLPTAWASVWPEAASNQPTQRAGTKLMEVLYDLPGTGAMTVRMEVPADKS